MNIHTIYWIKVHTPWYQVCLKAYETLGNKGFLIFLVFLGGNPPNPPCVPILSVQYENTRFRLLTCLGSKLYFAPVPLFSFRILNQDQCRFLGTFLLNPYQWILEKIPKCRTITECFLREKIHSATFHHLYMKSRSVMVQRMTYIFVQRGIFSLLLPYAIWNEYNKIAQLALYHISNMI